MSRPCLKQSKLLSMFFGRQRLTFVERSELCVSREFFQQPDETFFVDKRRGFDILGPDCDFVDSIGRKACNGVFVRAGLDRPHFHVVDAHGVLEVGVGGQPGDDGRGAGHIAGAHAGGSQGRIFANDHGTGGVLGCFPVDRHRSDADAMRLEKAEKIE